MTTGHDDAGWGADVERACAARGLQLTPLRRRVLSAIAASPAPLGAYALIDALSRSEGKAIAPPTVYRALEFFLEQGFVHRIESRNSYAPCAHVGHPHPSVLLICERCGRSEEIEDEAVLAPLDAAAARAGFAVTRLVVEAQGLCRRCADA